MVIQAFLNTSWIAFMKVITVWFGGAKQVSFTKKKRHLSNIIQLNHFKHQCHKRDVELY